MTSALRVRVQGLPFSPITGLWLTFLLVQVLDGVLTYIGVMTFGLGIEANPVVAWYASTFGPAAGLIAAKLFAVACASVLYMTARHGTAALLTIAYVVLAIVPWAHVLTRVAVAG
jgi:uncharacterized protein DUF5658